MSLTKHPAARFAVFAMMLMPLPLAAQTAPSGGMPPTAVGTVTLEPQMVPHVVTIPGRAVAAEATDIRPRSSGMITEILYQAGQPITVGTPMFRIDTATYDAAVAQAQAQVASADAALRQARAAFDRTSRLAGSGSTQADVDNAQAALDQARATVATAAAGLQLAEMQLGWTTVTSPINGMAGIAAVSVGDLVSANQAQALARVTALDPIEVDLFGPATRLLRMVETLELNNDNADVHLRATLTLEDGRIHAAEGVLISPGFEVSMSTGAIDTRFRFANPDFSILPGMFLRGQIEIGQAEAFLVPLNTASRDRQGNLTVWLAVEGTAQQRPVTDAGTYQHHWVIADGLATGDQLIVDNIARLQPGAPVAPVPVTIDAAGLVHDAAPAEAEAVQD